MKLVVATRNPGKLAELRSLLPGFEIVSLGDLPGVIPETAEVGRTFVENARLKALDIAGTSRCPTIADDSGLEVDALGGRPGVHSARYAGEGASAEACNRKLLDELRGVPEDKRTARFRCVIAYAEPASDQSATTLFEGVCEGRILEAPRGSRGFGYDPVFFCDALGMGLGEARPEQKNSVSHRAEAVRKLATWLRTARD